MNALTCKQCIHNWHQYANNNANNKALLKLTLMLLVNPTIRIH